MKKQSMNHRLSALAPLLLFVTLTTSILLVLLQGADIYQTIAKRNGHSYQKRTVSQYITTRIHQNDTSHSVVIGNFYNSADSLTLSGDTLFLLEEIDGRSLCTRIYCQDGYLRELFSESDSKMKPSSGQKILAMDKISYSLAQNLLTIRTEYSDGYTETLTLSLRSTQEATYEK